MGVGRLEVAHFWQDVCLSIAVHRTSAAQPEGERWIDAGTTRVRIRGIESVRAIPGAWGFVEWSPSVLVLLTVCGALFMEEPAKDKDGDDELLDRVRRLYSESGVPQAPDRVELFGASGRWLPNPWDASASAVNCTRGDVLVIVNETPLPIDVKCTDRTVNVPDVLTTFGSVRTTPDALKTCRFSRDGDVWSFPVEIAITPEDRLRQRYTWRDACGPTLFFYYMNARSTLVGTGAPVTPLFSEIVQPVTPRVARDPFGVWEFRR